MFFSFTGFSKENHDVAVQDMDQVNHLLCDLLEREDVALAVVRFSVLISFC